MYHDAPLPPAASEMLATLGATGVRVEVEEAITWGLPEDDLCDCALKAELVGPLLYNKLQLRDEDIVLTAEVVTVL